MVSNAISITKMMGKNAQKDCGAYVKKERRLIPYATDSKEKNIMRM